MGRWSVDLNFCDSDRADIDSFPRLGAECANDGGGDMLVGSSSSVGEVASGDVMRLPEDGNRGLWPKVAEPESCVRCDRNETDRLTFWPTRSETLDVRLSRLLSRLCPLRGLLFCLSAGSSQEGLRRPSALDCSACGFLPKRPNTEEEGVVVDKEGIAGADQDAYAVLAGATEAEEPSVSP